MQRKGEKMRCVRRRAEHTKYNLTHYGKKHREKVFIRKLHCRLCMGWQAALLPYDGQA
jgi:hypothetical protein